MKTLLIAPMTLATALLLSFSSLLCVRQTVAQPQPVRVCLMEKAEVDQDVVALSRIADLSGGDSAVVARLGDLQVGRAPLPGQTLRMTDAYLLVRFRQAGLGDGDVFLEGAPSVEITRSTIEVTGDWLSEVARNSVEQWMKREGYSGRISDVQAPDAVLVAKGDIELHAQLPEQSASRTTLPVRISIAVDGRVRREVTVTVKVEIQTEAVRTTRALQRGRIVTEDDVALKSVELSECPASAFARVEDVVGQRVRRSMEAFSLVRSDWVEIPPLVQRGDVVQIVAETPSMRIRTLGVVQSSEGGFGDRIRVVNLDSNRPVSARVVDAKTVKVDF